MPHNGELQIVMEETRITKSNDSLSLSLLFFISKLSEGSKIVFLTEDSCSPLSNNGGGKEMVSSFYSLIPPLLTIAMVILTKRVLLSLGVGIISSALLLGIDDSNGFFGVLSSALTFIWEAVKGIFVSDGELNTWNVFIIIFLLLLGIITAFITISGGSRAFGEWALKRVKTRVGAQFVSAILGIIIFIDDYFNALAVGQVSRPITDRHRVSRAKLAYIIDSTSAPVCVVSPVSSWGAYIIALFVPIFAKHSIDQYSEFSAFMQIIPMNLYVWVAIALVFLMAWRKVDIGAMKVHEQRAIQSGLVHDPEKTAPGEINAKLPISSKGTVGNLIWPIVALFVGTIGAMIWTGYSAVGEGATIFQIFENTDVAKSLLYGGLIGVAVALFVFVMQMKKDEEIKGELFSKGIGEGIKSMLPAIYILLFAWTIIDLIGRLDTGGYLAGVVESVNMDVRWLPVILFLIAGIMAFSTGTSWGSFGILLPIAADIVAVVDIELLLPSLAAVLAGSVFGDHCSPISDTTILSSTGAGCNHIDHVITQLPYAIISAIVASIGFILIGFTGNVWLSLLISLVLIVVLAFLLGNKYTKNETA